ncbi:hypothetical protein [Pedobacter sp.]
MKKFITISIGLLSISTVIYSQPYKKYKILENAYKLYINSNQGSISTNIEYDDQQNELIRSVQKPKNQIEIFNIKTGRLKKIIPTKISLLGSFTKISTNLFCIHDPIVRSYYLIDSYGKILDKIKEADYSNNIVYLHTSPYPYTPIIFYKNAFFVTGMVMFKDLNNIDPNKLKTTGIVEKFSFKQREVSYIGAPTIKALSNFYGNMSAYSLTLNKNNLICAPHFSDEILIINLDNNTSKLVHLKTKYGSQIKPLSTIPDAKKYSNFERNQYYKQSYTNIGFVYDKYRRIYYRFVRYPLKSPGAMEAAVLVFDENFNLLLDQKIDHKKYNVSKFFVSPKGLAILNIEKYKRNDINLIFDVFIPIS